MGTIVWGLFLAGWAYLFARLEIEIEGPVGWALGAPTFQKRSPIYAAIMGGKVLTGYHRIMFFLPLYLLLGCFALGEYWGVHIASWARLWELLGCFFLVSATWDFMWFPLNPHFGIARFRRGEIHWHKKWLTDRVPQDYPAALVATAIMAAMAHFCGGGSMVWARLLGVLVTLLIASAVVVLVAPRVQNWISSMRTAHSFAEDDWSPWLTPEELDDLKNARATLNHLRSIIASLGRRRAQREQLGKKISIQ